MRRLLSMTMGIFFTAHPVRSTKARSICRTHLSPIYSTSMTCSPQLIFVDMKTQDLFTWTDSEGIGTSTGGSNTINTTLGANSSNCSEYVSLYEDTIYHTFVYQVPTGNTGCQ